MVLSWQICCESQLAASFRRMMVRLSVSTSLPVSLPLYVSSILQGIIPHPRQKSQGPATGFRFSLDDTQARYNEGKQEAMVGEQHGAVEFRGVQRTNNNKS